MKMELQLEKDDCTIEINGTEYKGFLEATVEVDYTAGTSGSMRCGSSSYEDLTEAPTPASWYVDWAECTLTIFHPNFGMSKLHPRYKPELGKPPKDEVAILQFFGVDYLEALFGEIEEEHLDVDGLL